MTIKQNGGIFGRNPSFHDVNVNSIAINGVDVTSGISNLGTISSQDADSVNIDGGAVDGVTLGTNSAVTEADIDNINIDGNTISTTDTNGDLNLTPNGTGAVVTGNFFRNGSGSAFTQLDLRSSAAGGHQLRWLTGTSLRWVLSKSGAETGSNAGSNLTLFRYNDVGGFHGTVLTFSRSGGAITTGGNLTVTGALSKGSGSFRISHPLPEKEATHQLVHSFIEGPQIDLMYRGRINLVNGSAQVNIDEHFGMTSGTFEALCRDTQCFTSNEEGWHRVRGSVTGSVLTIECEDADCTDMISWMVIGERKDKHIMETDWTDENGKVILEPLKPENIYPAMPTELGEQSNG